MRAALTALVVCAALLACQPSTGGADAGAGVVPEFSLVDINPASARSGQQVKPSDYLGRVSGWYFTHST